MKQVQVCCPRMEAALTKGHKWARQICPNADGDLVIFTYAEDQGGVNSREENVKIDYCPFCGLQIIYDE